jgi:hypothetical protein
MVSTPATPILNFHAANGLVVCERRRQVDPADLVAAAEAGEISPYGDPTVVARFEWLPEQQVLA